MPNLLKNKDDKNTPNDTKKNKYELLTMEHFRAMEFKLEGYDYPEISQKTRVPKDTLKRWFCKKGILYQCYEEYKNEMLKIRAKEANEIFKAHLADVARKFVNIAGNGEDRDAINAGKEILDRGLGKVENTTTFKGDKNNPICIAEIIKNWDERKNKK